MFITSGKSWITVLGIIALAGAASAATCAIEGNVTDQSGKALAGADVKIESAGRKAWNTILKTDAKGRYVYNQLPSDGKYRVTLLMNGAVKASIANVDVKIGDATRLNFDLKKAAPSSKTASVSGKKKHKVWVPSETGSNLGGRWVEVEDGQSAGSAGTAGANPLQKANSDAVRSMQQRGGL
jgi:hypothetical protein